MGVEAGSRPVPPPTNGGGGTGGSICTAAARAGAVDAAAHKQTVTKTRSAGTPAVGFLRRGTRSYASSEGAPASRPQELPSGNEERSGRGGGPERSFAVRCRQGVTVTGT
jgi:hypothetical protein